MANNHLKLPSIFWSAIDQLGISRAAILTQAKLPLAVAQADARLSTQDFFKLYQALEQLGGVDIGVRLIAAIDNAQLPPAFLVAYYAKNLQDAIERVARYKHLCTPETLLLSQTANGLTVTIDWGLADVLPPNALIDATLNSLIVLAQQSTANNIQPIAITLTRPSSQAQAFYQDYQVQYDAPQNSITFDQHDLAIPFRQYNHDLVQILDNALQARLKASDTTTTFSTQVKWLLRQSLTAGRPELRFVAKELAISERSLQRHLKNEGESFQSLLSQTRHELACEYLKDERLDLAEISYLLGYEEPASFFRMFQDWENTTPTKWRQQYLSKNNG